MVEMVNVTLYIFYHNRKKMGGGRCDTLIHNALQTLERSVCDISGTVCKRGMGRTDNVN